MLRGMRKAFTVLQRDLAANVKEARVRLGLSQEALALSAEVDRTYVSQIERAVGNPSIGVLQRLALSLSTDVVDLLRHR